MSKLVIKGGNRLDGNIKVQGSKNASLPILAASILTDEECVIHNCPDISDIDTAIEILRELGAKAEKKGNTVTVRAANISKGVIPKEMMQKMRSSVMFMGAVLARSGEIIICQPGGCRLGDRPIDMHISSLSNLGAVIEEEGECIFCRLSSVCSGDITLLYPSVGATENIMLMCAGSDKKVNIYNAAREPEIVDLQNFLNMMGANISGAGSDTITVCGARRLCGGQYTVMSDRIAASTYACATAVCGGNVFISDADARHIRLVTKVLKEIGCSIEETETSLNIKSNGNLKALNMLKTLPYPGFPTDVQPMLSAVLSKSSGISHICETVFDNRFEYVKELKKMGAKITCDKCTATIKGVEKLRGAELSATDLRAGAALVIAALAGEGESSVSGIEYIDRGYEKIESAFLSLGANIKRV